MSVSDLVMLFYVHRHTAVRRHYAGRYVGVCGDGNNAGSSGGDSGVGGKGRSV